MHPIVETGAAVQVRLNGSVFDSLENWRRAQDKIPPRSVAIRQLLQRALGVADQRGERA
jgi:hypothetical protein